MGPRAGSQQTRGALAHAQHVEEGVGSRVATAGVLVSKLVSTVVASVSLVMSLISLDSAAIPAPKDAWPNNKCTAQADPS